MKSKKVIISFVLALAMVITAFPFCPIYADGGSNNWETNITWSYANKTLEISGTGEIQSNNLHNYPWFKYAGETETLVIGNGITVIPQYAFYEFEKLKTVSLPNSLKEIGSNAFSQTFRLENIVLPEGIEKIGANAFFHAGSYTDKEITLNIPNSLLEISNTAFDRATIITTFAIDNNANFIVTDGAIFSSNGKTLLCFPAGYEGDFEIPSGVETIACSFEECKTLTQLSIPSSVTSFTDSFWGFATISLSAINVDENNQYFKSVDGVLFNKDGSSLILYPASKTDESYTVPLSVNRIEGYAFNSTYYLERLIVSESAISVSGIDFGYKTPFHKYFWNKTLTIVSVPYSSIHEAALEEGFAFEAIDGTTLAENSCGVDATWSYDESTKTLTINGSGKVYYQKAWDSFKKNIKRAELSEGITDLGDAFFRYWYSLETVKLPSTLETVGYEAFDYSGIKELEIPQSLTTLGSGSVFIGCSTLTSISVAAGNTLFAISNGALLYIGSGQCDLMWYPSIHAENIVVPDGVTSISYHGWTFYNNPELKTIYLPKTVDFIAEYAFYNVTSLEAIYYEGTQDQWQAIRTSSSYSNWYQRTNFSEATVYYTVELEDYLEATATENVIGDVIWTFANGVLTFKGTGLVGGYAFDSTETPWNSIMKDITEIVFEDGITTIAGLALYQKAVNLEKVTIPKSVVSIGRSVFSRLDKLTEFVVDTDNEFYSAYDGVLYSKDMQTLIQYPCGKVGAYVMPDTVKNVSKSEVFGSAEKLTSVHIPENFAGDLTSAFHFNTSLSAISVDENNTVYKSVNGVLYSKDGTKLYCYPADKDGATYYVLDGTQKILYCAFHSCKKIKQAYVPDSVLEINTKDLYSEVTFVFADSSKCGMDAYWDYHDGILTISGTGVLFPYHGNSGLRPWQEYINNIRTVVVKEGITQIPEGVFLTLTKSNVDYFIPRSVVSIDDNIVPAFNAQKVGHMFYAGSASEWSALNINDGLTNINNICQCDRVPVYTSVVGSSTIKTGTTFDVEVILENSTIFNNLALQIDYDSDKLELQNVVINYVEGNITTSNALTTTPYVIMWTANNHLIHLNNDQSGKNQPIATFTFKAKENATLGNTEVSINYYGGQNHTYIDGINVNFNEAGPLEMSYTGSAIKLSNYYAGDINQDNVVDSSDVITLLNYIVGNSVTVNEDALDFDENGEVDPRDAVALLRNIVGGESLF